MSVEIEELACAACGKTEDEAEQIIENSGTDDMLFERYGVDFETYCRIAMDLLPLTPVVTSALVGNQYHAFVRGGVMIAKAPYKGDQ